MSRFALLFALLGLCDDDAPTPPPAAPQATHEEPAASVAPTAPAPQREIVAPFVHDHPPLAIAQYGRGWVTGTNHGEVLVWSEDAEPVARFAVAGMVLSIDTLDDRIAVGTNEGGLYSWRELEPELTKHASELDHVHDVALLPDGRVASAHGGESSANGHRIVEPTGPCGVCVWSRSGERLWGAPRDDERDWVTALDVSPGGERLASGHSTGRVRIWNVSDGSRSEDERLSIGRIDAIRWVEDGHTLIAGGVDGIASFAPPNRPERIIGAERVITLDVHEDWIVWGTVLEGWGRAWRDGSRRSSHHNRDRAVARGIAFAEDGSIGVLGERRIFGWNSRWLRPEVPAGTPREMRLDGDIVYLSAGVWLQRYEGEANDNQELHPNTNSVDKVGEVMAYTHSHNRLMLKLGDGPPRRISLPHRGDGLGLVRFSESRKYLAVATYDRTFIVDVYAGQLHREIRHPSDAARFAWNGDILSMVTREPAFRVYSMDGEQSAEMELPAQPTALSHAGDHHAIGLADGRVLVLREGELVHTLEGREGAVQSVSLSSDGSRVASGGEDHRIIVHSTRDGQSVRTLEAHHSPVAALAYRRDGVLVSAGLDGIRWWPANVAR